MTIEGSTSCSETNSPGGACFCTSALAGPARRRKRKRTSASRLMNEGFPCQASRKLLAFDEGFACQASRKLLAFDEGFACQASRKLLAFGDGRGLARRVRDPAPIGLGGELDRLVVALGLDVAEGVGRLVERDVELALLHALVEPGGAEHEPAQPVHERALGRPDELGPAVVDVLAEGGGGVLDLAVDGQVDEVLELDALEPRGHEAELERRLLDALGEVALVEGEAQLAVFQDVVLA